MNIQSINRIETQKSSSKDLVSACGLYCGACGIYQATQENDTEKLLQYAIVLNQSFEETLCDGCGSARKSLHCSQMCNFIDCKLKNGVDFCIDCNEFPCQTLVEFKSKMPHRVEIIESQKRREKIGLERWLYEMNDLFSCIHCKTVNGAYHLVCRRCGNTPSCKFVLHHKETIEQYLAR